MIGASRALLFGQVEGLDAVAVEVEAAREVSEFDGRLRVGQGTGPHHGAVEGVGRSRAAAEHRPAFAKAQVAGRVAPGQRERPRGACQGALDGLSRDEHAAAVGMRSHGFQQPDRVVVHDDHPGLRQYLQGGLVDGDDVGGREHQRPRGARGGDQRARAREAGLSVDLSPTVPSPWSCRRMRRRAARAAARSIGNRAAACLRAAALRVVLRCAPAAALRVVPRRSARFG